MARRGRPRDESTPARYRAAEPLRGIVTDLSIGLEAALSGTDGSDVSRRSRAADLLATDDDPADFIYEDVKALNLGGRGNARPDAPRSDGRRPVLGAVVPRPPPSDSAPSPRCAKDKWGDGRTFSVIRPSPSMVPICCSHWALARRTLSSSALRRRRTTESSRLLVTLPACSSQRIPMISSPRSLSTSISPFASSTASNRSPSSSLFGVRCDPLRKGSPLRMFSPDCSSGATDSTVVARLPMFITATSSTGAAPSEMRASSFSSDSLSSARARRGRQRRSRHVP